MVQISSRRNNIYKKDTKQFKQKNKSFPEIGSESINENYRHHENKYKMLKVIVYLIFFLFFFPVYLFRFCFHRYQNLFDRIPTLLELRVSQQNCFRESFSEILNRNSEKMYSKGFLTFLMRCFAENPDLQLFHIRKQPLKNFVVF